MDTSSIDRNYDPAYNFVQNIYLNIQRCQYIALIVQTNIDLVILFVYTGYNLFDLGFYILINLDNRNFLRWFVKRN